MITLDYGEGRGFQMITVVNMFKVGPKLLRFRSQIAAR